MINSLRLAILSAAACVASFAATYKVSIPVDVTLEGQQLKPGIYKVEVNENNAVFTKGKQKVETKVHTETADRKFGATSVRYVQANGSLYNLSEVSVGGTATKLIFDNAPTTKSGL